MKTLVAIAVLAALAGCATPPRTVSYAGAYAQPVDPQGWRVVSVTPVAPGTGAQLAAAQGTGSSTTTTTTPVDMGAQQPQYTSQPIQYTSQPVQYVSQPVYVAAPVYVPAPVYYRDPYYDYYPPVSLSLGFMFGNGGWGHRGGGWGRGGVGLGVGFHGHR
jgi:hypothetical protein